MNNSHHNYIKVFYKTKRIAAIIAIISILYVISIIVLGILFGDVRNCKYNSALDVLLQLACSYIAGVIIYIITSLISDVSRDNEIQGKISAHVQILRIHMEECFAGLSDTYFVKNKDEYSAEDFAIMEKSFNPKEEIKRIQRVKDGKIVWYTCYDWISGYSRRIANDIAEMQKLYATFINTELFVLLNKISNAMLQKNIPHLMLVVEKNLTIGENTGIFEEYYNLINELNSYLEKYKPIHEQ